MSSRTSADIGGSHAIESGPSIGAQNILLMGLESRTDWQGNILPSVVLQALHACNAAEVAAGCGGNDTNTLILIHIPAGGGKATGFSIPRDDWVNFADTLGSQQTGKIDQAYGVSMAAKESQLRAQDPSMSQDQLAYEGNEAGRAATVATVEQLTGVHVDHFAEVNLDGFYELAKVLGGVEVCLNHPVPYDVNSGFSAAHAGYQHLNAKQALAFVRQRDGLPNGDLDRTHRQQAFLDSVIQQLNTEGVLNDLTKVQALLSVAQQYVITDSGWDLLDFVAQMRDLNSANLTFRTLPIVGYQTIDGQDANVVNPAYIQQIVQEVFYPAVSTPAASPSASATATATRATARSRWTSTTAAAPRAWPDRSRPPWSRTGIRPGRSATPARCPPPRSSTGRAHRRSASKIASLFSVSAAASSSVAAGHVEVMLGADAALPASAPATPSATRARVRVRRWRSRPPARRAARSTPRTASPA